MQARTLLLAAALATLATARADEGARAPVLRQRVATLQTMTAPCLSVRVSSDVSVAVPEPVLQRYVAARPTGPRPQGAPDPEHLARVWGDRAHAWVQLDADTADRYGCRSVPLERLGDAQYLLGQLLKSGQAMVTVDGQARAEAAVMLRETTCHEGPLGMWSYRLENGQPFFHLVTCVV
ncbi:hypothetical protein [Stenotrophomonas sp.]|uniref:hypothetical protein n=1 Tax=Stenotrophomonas sp. TaxID=69392 RepID=UPI0028B04EF8|nr:hypothetical protein [Stenotrophomonas sp.]